MIRFGGSSAPTSRGTTRRAIGFVIRGNGAAIIKIAATAFLGGVAEALFLITIARAAFAVASQETRITVMLGWELSVNSTLLLAVGLIATRLAFAGYTSWQSASVASRIVARLRQRLSRAFFDASWEVQQAQRAGSLQQLITDYSGSASGLMGSLTGGIVTAANLIALFGTAVAVNPIGAIVLVGSIVVLGLLLRPLRSIVRRRAQAVSGVGMELATSVTEVAELGLELHVFNVQDRAAARVGEAIERAREAIARLQFANSLSSPAYSGLAYLALVGALGVVAASNANSLTSLGAAMLVMLRSLSYGQAAQSAYLGVAGSIPAIEELQSRLHVFEAGRRDDDGQHVGRVGAVSMENVSFGYPQSDTVLHDVSFTIMPHEIIGIVGPSGAGKSTLVQLLLGLRDPDEGKVLAGGRDIRTFDRAEWARKMTFVPQDAHFIDGTIADNIRFLRENVSQHDIERAACLAHLHDDIAGFPEGYGRQVGKHGGHLSGGQQQRLCIARALVEHPDVLILDEPTSALDVRSEHLIRNTLLGLKDRMTVIVIAHRLSTLTICDRIMVIKDGALKAFAAPSDLEQSSEFYREALVLSGMR